MDQCDPLHQLRQWVWKSISIGERVDQGTTARPVVPLIPSKSHEPVAQVCPGSPVEPVNPAEQEMIQYIRKLVLRNR